MYDYGHNSNIEIAYCTYDSIDTDLQGSHPGHDLVVRIILIIIGNQLAVDIAHCVGLWHQIEDDIGLWT